jgi:hypothetical protein
MYPVVAPEQIPPFVEIDIDYAWFFTSSQQAKESPCIMAPTTEKE